MGIIEQMAADIAAITAALAGGAAAAPAKKTAPKKPAEREASKPTFGAEELRDKFIEVQAKHGDVVAKQLIADCGFDKLAKLIADTDNWQAHWDAAEAKLAEDAGEDDDGSGL